MVQIIRLGSKANGLEETFPTRLLRDFEVTITFNASGRESMLLPVAFKRNNSSSSNRSSSRVNRRSAALFDGAQAKILLHSITFKTLKKQTNNFINLSIWFCASLQSRNPLTNPITIIPMA